MSVTVVNAIPKSMPAAPADNSAPASDAQGAQTPDFAALLLGQIPLSTAEMLAPDTQSAPSEPATDPLAASDVPEALVTALGLVTANAAQPATGSKGGQSGELAIGKRLQAPDAAPQTARLSGEPAVLMPAANENTLRATTEPSAGTFLPADNKPAIFADPALTAPLHEIPANLRTTPHAPLHAQRDATLSVETPLRDAQWGADFSQKIVWAATNDRQTAQLTLNPPQMGPIEISMNIDKGSASVSFVSANAEVRENIESALPRLREMLASAGIELGQTHVGAESFRQPGNNGSAEAGVASRLEGDQAILEDGVAGSLPSRAFVTHRGQGMVDLFA